MEDIIEIVNSLEDSRLLLKGVTETVQKELKEEKEDFLVCYQAHQVQVYWEIFQQLKE